MKRISRIMFFAITLFAVGCQSALPVRLNVSLADPNESIPAQNNNLDSEIEPIDGKRNNIANTNWGSTGVQLLRFSPAQYADGISAPAGADRPSPRAISNALSSSPEDGITNDRDFTAFVYAWGQFLDHDIDLTDTASPSKSFPVIVPTGDKWFDPNGTGTMTILFSRSNFDSETGTSQQNPRQQINSITAFIDGSQIYGSDAERAAALREFNGGRMKVSAGNFLPFNTSGFENANDAHILPDDQLYLAGDIRANENPELLSLHTLFIREHNRIAAEAARRHPDWTDEQLYQFARRMVIAEIQKITYEEFLPALFGKNALPAYRGYQSDVNPGIATEFSTAAFRLGHSMLGDDIEFLDNDGNEMRDAMGLRDSFFNSTVLQQTDIDPILKYLASDNAQEIDLVVVDDVRNFLFGQPGQGGFDLASLNIQRGRDHGLADYNTVRVSYGLPRVTSFAQITSDEKLQASLASLYGSVDNIDLWVGGLAEDHLPNSSVGATFTAILVDQFTRLRDGDRFWYQLSLPDNLARDIQNTSLPDIIRRNTKLTKLQADVFFFNDLTVMIDSSTTAADTDSQNNQPRNGVDHRQPPQAAVDACSAAQINSSCSFTWRNGNIVTGTCQLPPNTSQQLACVSMDEPHP